MPPDPAMPDAARSALHPRRRRPAASPPLRRAWCCSFGVVPPSPDNTSNQKDHHHRSVSAVSAPKPPRPPAKPQPSGSPFQSSPSPTSRTGLGLIDPRRILSPGRVSPIDSDYDPHAPSPASAGSPPIPEPEPEPREDSSAGNETKEVLASDGGVGKVRCLDLRVGLKGKDGRGLVLELDSEVLCGSSGFFAEMVSGRRGEFRKIEVANVEDVEVFKETIELMYEKDAMQWLMRAGVSKAVDVLEVSSTIVFERGVLSCLRYLEAVPWSENDEEKLKSLIARCTFDEAIIQDVMQRLYSDGPIQPEHMALHLVQAVASGENITARRDLKSLVKGLLSRSSVYQKDHVGISKEGLYSICNSCLFSLRQIFEEACDSAQLSQTARVKDPRPLIERVSKQVDNLAWLFEILVENQIAEAFVELWANQNDLIKMHESASPMVRYEVSRVSACVFMAVGRGKLQCRGDTRHQILKSWFGPMLSDFGWLQRCHKGLDVRMLEEALGQVLLTLSLKQQECLFVEWFRCFAACGTECPNLSGAFQVWWRRSFSRSMEGDR